MSDKTRIIHQETRRDYRTEIPNIVFELLESGEISHSAFSLYAVLRRIAGEHGSCWYGVRGLVKKCNLSHVTIIKLKKVLSQKFKKLGGKSLIQITPGDPTKEEADTITIVDIWPDNYPYFKNKLSCERNLTDPVKDTLSPPVNELYHKKEPLKNKPLKNLPPLTPPFESDKPKPESKKPMKDKPPKKEHISLRSEEEDTAYKILENTSLNSKEKLRLTRQYSEDEVARALKIAETQPIKRTLMALLVNILTNPDSWDVETSKPRSSNEQMALNYNQRLRKVSPKLAKSNEDLIEIGGIVVILNTGPTNISMRSDYFLSDMKEANTYLDALEKQK